MVLPFIAAEIKASYLERHCRDLPLHKGYSLMSTLCVRLSPKVESGSILLAFTPLTEFSKLSDGPLPL